MNAKKKLADESAIQISSLFKMMLMLVEDMKKDHDFHYNKLYDEIPKKYLLAAYWPFKSQWGKIPKL